MFPGLFVSRQNILCCLVTALLQSYACFDLSRLVSEEQILPLCSLRGRLCGLTRWKMLSRVEGSYFSFKPETCFFTFLFWSKTNAFSLQISTPWIAHLSLAHFLLLGFCCHWGRHCLRTSRCRKPQKERVPTVRALIQLSLVPCEEKGIGICVFVFVCVSEMFMDYWEVSLCCWASSGQGRRHWSVVLGSQHINLTGCSQRSEESAFQQQDRVKYDLPI